MYKVGDYIVYLKEVSKIKEIKENFIKNVNYYVLEPVSDSSLKLIIPVSSNSIRNLITIDKVNELIKEIPFIDTIDIDNKNIEFEYKKLLNTGTPENLIKIIKTTYLRNQDRLNNKKKINDKDRNYFELAEKYLYTEISIVLNKSFEDTKNYIINEVEKELSHE